MEEQLIQVGRSIPRFSIDKAPEEINGAVLEQRRRLDVLLEAFVNSLDQLDRVIEPILLPIEKEAKRNEVRESMSVPLAREFAWRCDVLESLITRLNATIARVSI